MADVAEILKTFSSLVVDYSSMFELGNPDLLDSLIEYVIQQNKTVQPLNITII